MSAEINKPSQVDPAGRPFYFWREEMKSIETCHKLVGLRIQHMRETLGITQGDLAKRVGLERTSVVNTEAGRQRLLLHGVENYAKALGTTPKHLMKGIWW